MTYDQVKTRAKSWLTDWQRAYIADVKTETKLATTGQFFINFPVNIDVDVVGEAIGADLNVTVNTKTVYYGPFDTIGIESASKTIAFAIVNLVEANVLMC